MSHDETLKALIALGDALPGSVWEWTKSYEMDSLHWAITTPETSLDGRVLDTDTVLLFGPCEKPPDDKSPQPSPIMQLWVAAANAREAIKVMHAENRQMREMLFIVHSKGRGYHDDGELQDNSMSPWIDWKRDSIDDIRRKLQERANVTLRGVLKRRRINEELK